MALSDETLLIIPSRPFHDVVVGGCWWFRRYPLMASVSKLQANTFQGKRYHMIAFTFIMRPGAWRYENSIANNLHQRLFSIRREGDAIICKKKVSSEIPHRKFLFFNAQRGSMDDWVTCLEVDWILLSMSRLSFWTSWKSFNFFKQTLWPSYPAKLTQPPTCPKALAGFELNGSEIILQERRIRVKNFLECENNKNIFIYSILLLVHRRHFKKDCSCSWKSMKF